MNFTYKSDNLISLVEVRDQQLIEAIKNDIAWHSDEKNRQESGVTKEQADWFVKGLEQAIKLIDVVPQEMSVDTFETQQQTPEGGAEWGIENL